MLEKRVLLVLLLAVSAALAWILLPFYGTILWGAIIALLFAPLYRACCRAWRSAAPRRRC